MTDSSVYTQTTQMLALCKFGGVGPRLFDALFGHYGSLPAILDADRQSLLSIPGMTEALADKIKRANGSLEQADQYAGFLKERDIAITTRLDDAYSHHLFELNDPPTLLYVRGRMPDTDRKSVTLMGAEDATNTGLEITSSLAKAFAVAGVQVVSSLTGGVDLSAHLGCRAAAGNSFAVLATGFDHLDQSAQMPLAVDIAHGGGVLSEYSPDFVTSETALQESNRLLVGLSQAVVVTELYGDSARALDLLEFCLQIGKLTFILSDSTRGVVTDNAGYDRAVECGAIPLDGIGRVDDIIKSLV
ncbi:MAG: DNA-processing protein DprA [Candidatus Zixiibacteriota bacterium]